MAEEPDWIATPRLRPDFRGPTTRPFVPFPDPAEALPIVVMLEAIVRRQPSAIAAEDAGGEITYDALWRAVCALAGRIRAADALPSAPVAILLPATVEYLAAVYACLLAGRPCVLLDNAYPEARNAEVVLQTGVGLILCAPNQAANGIDQTEASLLGVSVRDDADAPGVGTGASPALALDAPAFVLTTSGSAGRPKPIVHSQRTLLHWARTTHDALHVRADDRVLSLSSLSSLGGFTGLLNFSLAGACVQMIDLKASGLAGLLETLVERPVTLLRAAPSLLRGLVKLPDTRAAFARLRAVQTYGEPLTRADVTALRDVLPSNAFVRCTYGSTEASGLSWFAGPGDDYDPVRVAAGCLMPDTMAAIVDDTGRSCGPGEVGELVIRSRYNALGEWVDDRLIDGRLQAHPSGDGTRVFHTGDLARYHPDGVFVVLGRRDRMAKINGQRLEPAEVEAVVRAQAGVAEAEAVVQAGAASSRLVVFVVAQCDAPADLLARLRTALRGALPAYMVPSRVVRIVSMPRLPGGKVDAMRLLAMANEGVAPMGEPE